MKKIVILLLIIFSISQNIFAMVEFHKVKAIHLIEKCKDEYTLVFKPTDELGTHKIVTKDRVLFLHIRFKPRCITSLIQSKELYEEKKKYLNAINILKKQVESLSEITIGLKSGQGFFKVPNKPYEYQCDNLAILDLKNEKIVYAIHADVTQGYCDIR